MAQNEYDLRNYLHIDHPLDRQSTFAKALAARLGDESPLGRLTVSAGWDPADENFPRSYHTKIKEVVGEVFGFIPIKRNIVELIDNGAKTGGYVNVLHQDLLPIVKQAVNYLNDLSGAEKKVSLSLR